MLSWLFFQELRAIACNLENSAENTNLAERFASNKNRLETRLIVKKINGVCFRAFIELRKFIGLTQLCQQKEAVFQGLYGLEMVLT